MSSKTVATSVISSLIAATLFFLFLQPALRNVQDTIAFISNNIYSAYAEGLYRNAALGLRSYVPAIVYRTFVALLWSAYLGAITGYLVTSYIKSKSKSSELIANVIRNGHVLKWVRIILTVCICATIFTTLLYMTYHVIVFYSDIQMNVSFNQRLSILAPYLSEEQEEGLAAMWASMTGRADYENVNAELENYAEQFNVELPELFWK